MSEAGSNTQQPPFRNPYLARLGFGLCAAILIVAALTVGGNTGSVFSLLTMLGGAMIFASYAIDPWPLSAGVFSTVPTPSGPRAALAKRFQLLAVLLFLTGFAWRIFA